MGLWDQLRTLANNCLELWLLLGDFSAILSHGDRARGDPVTPHETVDFQNCVDDIGDYNYTAAYFLEPGCSDHSPIQMNSTTTHTNLRKPFRLLNVVMQQRSLRSGADCVERTYTWFCNLKHMEEAPINSKTGKAITKRILYIGKEVDSTKEETTRAEAEAKPNVNHTNLVRIIIVFFFDSLQLRATGVNEYTSLNNLSVLRNGAFKEVIVSLDEMVVGVSLVVYCDLYRRR
ncbi:hypothetical protein FXO38_15790 [Capsicum annuum]|nr:hypothetical protein FXO38_15790 [Capsicum annuum]